MPYDEKRQLSRSQTVTIRWVTCKDIFLYKVKFCDSLAVVLPVSCCKNTTILTELTFALWLNQPLFYSWEFVIFEFTTYVPYLTSARLNPLKPDSRFPFQTYGNQTGYLLKALPHDCIKTWIIFNSTEDKTNGNIISAAADCSETVGRAIYTVAHTAQILCTQWAHSSTLVYGFIIDRLEFPLTDCLRWQLCFCLFFITKTEPTSKQTLLIRTWIKNNYIY